MDITQMPIWLIASWIFFILLAIWIIQKVAGKRYSTEIAVSGAIIYSAIIVKMAAFDDDFSYFCLFYLLICLRFIYYGSKQVPFKTQTALFDEITGKPIPGKILQAGIHFTDPILEKVTASTNGEPDVTVDMQEVRIKIHQTPQMQTKTRGIKALVRHIGLMLKLKGGDLSRAFDVEGGVETMKKRIEDYVFEIVNEKISQTEAQRMDQDKKKFIHDELAPFIKDEVNKFCLKPANNYPYEIDEDVTIGDTELDEIYYIALGKKAITIMEQEAENEKAKMIRERLLETGKFLMPGGSEAEQLRAAQVSLGIVPKTITEKKIALDVDTLQAARQLIADIVLGKKK